MKRWPGKSIECRRAVLAACLVLTLTFCLEASAAPPAVTTAPASSPSMGPDSTEPGDDRLPFMAAYDRGGDEDQPGGFGMVARTLGALLLIIGLLVGSMWCLRRIKGQTGSLSREDGRLTLLNSLSIGDRRSLTVVRFGDRVLLIGSTPQSCTLLASDECDDLLPIPPEEFPARSVADVLSENCLRHREPSFASHLDQVESWGGQDEGTFERDPHAETWR